MSNPRQLAATVLQRVLEDGAYSNLALDQALSRASDLSPQDRALATEIVYGTLTRLRSIDAILACGVHKNLRKLEPQILSILRCAVYQLAYLDRIPARAVLHEAAEHAKQGRSGKKRAGFVNGALRGVQRNKDKWPTPTPLANNPVKHIGEASSMPNWIARLLLQQFEPEEASLVAQSLLERPELHLRVLDPKNRDKEAQLLGAKPTRWSPSGLVAPGMTPEVRKALSEKRIVIQDEAAQLVGWLANPSPKTTTLDACAGLGGKTAHLASFLQKDTHFVAVEPHGKRLKLLSSQLEKLELPQAKPVNADFRETSAEDLNAPFDLVVVDAPCSGLGVLRRHPEARWTRKSSDIDSLAQLQSEILERAADLVAPGGHLVYSVCTFTRAEGQDQVQNFLQKHPEFSVDLQGHPDVPWEKLAADENGILALPHKHGTDGFYLTRLRKNPS